MSYDSTDNIVTIMQTLTLTGTSNQNRSTHTEHRRGRQQL